MPGAAFSELVGILEEVIDISGIAVNKNTVLGDDMPVDSADMLRLISRIESKYSFKFLPEDILSLKTVGDILEVINSRVCSERKQ